jgi:hypothetical protein
VKYYDPETALAIASRTIGWRLLHLQGRALGDLLPKAVERLEDYTWVDGELVCGLVLGYNFGDGHLHDEEFLNAVQQQCGFEEGELRVVMVEAQPLARHTCDYRIHDAMSGKLAEGQIDVRDLRGRQAWEPTEH